MYMYKCNSIITISNTIFNLLRIINYETSIIYEHTLCNLNIQFYERLLR